MLPLKLRIAQLDGIAIAACLLAVSLLARRTTDARATVWLAALLATGAAWQGMLYLTGAYDDSRVLSAWRSWVRVLAPAAVGGAVFEAILPGFHADVFAIAALAAAGTMLAARMVLWALVSRGFAGVRFVIVGRGKDLGEAAELVEGHAHAGLIVAAVVDLGRAHAADHEPSLEERALSARPDCVVIVGPDADDPAMPARLRRVCYDGIALLDRVALEERVARRVRADLVDDRWLLAAATLSSLGHIRWAKRAFDLAGSVVLLVVASPLLAVAAALVKLTSPGPVLYRQERVGRHGASFTVLKLRTMHLDAESRSGPVWSTDADPRITPLGRYLRKFRVDELPQLWNVLRGEMSLIGPRPERPMFVEQLARVIPHYRERHLVRPGITGWAQVMAPYAASVEDARHKHAYDLYYVKHVSMTLDLLILLKTVRTVLFGRERQQGGLVTTSVPVGSPAVERRVEAGRRGEAKENRSVA